jgi:hypothetical protein
MPKSINPIKKAKVKKGLLEGKSLKQAVKDAGYSPKSAINAWRLAVVRCCLEEIKQELQDKFTKEDITVDAVLKDIEIGKRYSLEIGDMANYKGFCELEGRYLSLFTDNIKHSGQIDFTQAEKDEVKAKRDSVFNASPIIN